ncbi:hypothetical protein B0H11DRAFT_1984160 [Mycena galericulata]|nr:hypothetical protein B0H11DRAFT_1984160 [Mycena galericulata]
MIFSLPVHIEATVSRCIHYYLFTKHSRRRNVQVHPRRGRRFLCRRTPGIPEGNPACVRVSTWAETPSGHPATTRIKTPVCTRTIVNAARRAEAALDAAAAAGGVTAEAQALAARGVQIVAHSPRRGEALMRYHTVCRWWVLKRYTSPTESCLQRFFGQARPLREHPCHYERRGCGAERTRIHSLNSCWVPSGGVTL